MVDLNERNVANSKERKFYILSSLLKGKHLSYNTLSERYYVSRSSIANDINYLKEYLMKDNVTLSFDNSGTYISGFESEKQKVLKRLITNFLSEENMNSNVLQLFVDLNLLYEVKKIIEHKAERAALEISENYLLDIVISTTILIQRGKNGYVIEQADSKKISRTFCDLEKYPLVHELLEEVEKTGIYSFTGNELHYLSYIVIGNGFRYFMKDKKVPEKFKRNVEVLVKNIGQDLGIDFSQDIRLKVDLLTHLYQMLFRIKSGTNVVNPLLKGIKRDYPTLYGIVWYALREFGNKNDLEISDDEVAFVTIYFQAAIERNELVTKILFVCPNGIGVSSLLSTRLRKALPRNSSLEIAAIANISERKLSTVDLIISTVNLQQINVPVVKISPRVTSNDMKLITNKLIDLTTSNVQDYEKSNQENDTVKKIISNKIFFGTMNNREQVLDYLINSNEWKSTKNKYEYKESVLKREKFQSTYLGNGFVLPHGDPDKVDVSGIAVFILDKPIHWSGHKVDVVCLLMVRGKSKDILEPFMRMVMRGIEDKEWFKSKMKED